MLQFNGILRFNSKLFLLICGLIGVNFLLSFLVQYYKFKSVANYLPAGFGFGWIATILILIFGSLLIYKLKLLTKFPLTISFLIAGSITNFLEYTIFGFVVDYINIGIAILNLADVEIYFGLILINWKVFFGASS